MDYFYIWHKWSLSLEGVSHVTLFSESGNLNFWQIFEIFWLWPWKKKSTVLDGFFPYLAKMITSMRGYVAYNDLWPWPISSRSFSLGLENRVRSVASTVLDGFFPYLVQMVTSMRRCVACDDLWSWPISSRSFNLDFENRVPSNVFSSRSIIFLTWDPIWLNSVGNHEAAGGILRTQAILYCMFDRWGQWFRRLDDFVVAGGTVGRRCDDLRCRRLTAWLSGWRPCFQWFCTYVVYSVYSPHKGRWLALILNES